MQLFVYDRCAVSTADFVEFWSRLYNYPKERLYTNNIGQPLTPESVRDLFEWKNGTRLADRKSRSIQTNFIDHICQVEKLAPDTSPADFLLQFSEGGAIFRIFWLHCWQHERFPIYDQHVHRAMMHIEAGCIEEITNSDQAKIDLYVEQYLPFWQRFADLDPRKVDMALWSFGKFIKRSRFPDLNADRVV